MGTQAQNEFKTSLLAGKLQLGLWLSTGTSYPAEIAARAGFDWLVIDAEHGPNDLRSILEQLQVLHAFSPEPVVRPPVGEKWMIKQLLDLGARTLLIPMVNAAEEARELVRSVCYPPLGDRGMGAMVARVSGFGTRTDYVEKAGNDICLLIQVETKQALQQLPEIAEVEGVDGIFIGPADLSADMGSPMQSESVMSAIYAAIAQIRSAGKGAGIMTSDEVLNRSFIEHGATFVAVGADVTELTTALQALSAKYKDDGRHDGATSSGS